MRAVPCAFFMLLAACNRDKASSSGEQPAPSASVITLGVALGTCPDLAVCQKECEGGSADRCRRLGATYALGEGVTQDEARGAGLYAKACQMHDPSACMFAGQMYEFAHGVPKDDAMAEHYYEVSCALGWAPGCYNQAIMLENGRGVPQDRVKASDLYQIACTAGAKSACEKARELHALPVPPFLEGGLP
jgi:TPR repeat protein